MTGCSFITAHSSGSEVRSLFQDFVGHRNLAQIVQIPAAAQGHDRFLVKTEMAAQVAGIDAPGVRSGLRCRDRGSPHSSARVHNTDSAVSSSSVNSLSLSSDLTRANSSSGKIGLLQKIVGTRFDSQHPVLTIGEAGNQHERD